MNFWAEIHSVNCGH
uniref:Uncharacterized protein n=1 Tax=Ficus carica TaxID=3494 RepID=A0AA88EMS3_FICCA|nr:hypothetical protein TIFTF001_054482 [Ficus carica]GMN74930.1 hypothetical protein TIFTF001_054483 [Ficus carica]